MATTPVRRAIYGKLSGDTTLSNMLGPAAPGYTKGIYTDVAPPGSGFPFVVFFKQSGTPTYTMAGSAGKFESDIWTIKGVATNSTSLSGADAAEAIQARIDTLLTDQTLTISGSSLMLLKRISDVEYSETPEDITFYHRGSLFRLMYQ